MTKLKIAPPPAATQVAPQNIAAQMTITAFSDGKPMDIQATCAPLDGLLLLAAQKQVPAQTQADPVDKERKFLGPRTE